MNRLLPGLVLMLLLFVNCKKSEPPVRFQSVHFSTGLCFGFCPVFDIYIDSTRNFYLHRSIVYVEYRSPKYGQPLTGFFKGTVTDSLYNTFLSELNTIGLDSLVFNGATCCDGSLIHIDIQYNGKSKSLMSMFPPDNASDLIATLNDICFDNPVTPCDTAEAVRYLPLNNY